MASWREKEKRVGGQSPYFTADTADRAQVLGPPADTFHPCLIRSLHEPGRCMPLGLLSDMSQAMPGRSKSQIGIFVWPNAATSGLDGMLGQRMRNTYEDDKVEINIRLEKFTESDFDDYCQLMGDERVMAMITGRALTVDEASVRYERLLAYNQRSGKLGIFKILEAETRTFIGLAKLEIKDSGDMEAELGYAILPVYWGKGIASSAAAKLIERARGLNEVTRLFAIIDPNNVPSRRILVNNGFVTRAFRDFEGMPGEILELRL